MKRDSYIRRSQLLDEAAIEAGYCALRRESGLSAEAACPNANTNTASVESTAGGGGNGSRGSLAVSSPADAGTDACPLPSQATTQSGNSANSNTGNTRGSGSSADLCGSGGGFSRSGSKETISAASVQGSTGTNNSGTEQGAGAAVPFAQKRRRSSIERLRDVGM